MGRRKMKWYSWVDEHKYIDLEVYSHEIKISQKAASCILEHSKKFFIPPMRYASSTLLYAWTALPDLPDPTPNYDQKTWNFSARPSFVQKELESFQHLLNEGIPDADFERFAKKLFFQNDDNLMELLQYPLDIKISKWAYEKSMDCSKLYNFPFLAYCSCVIQFFSGYFDEISSETTIFPTRTIIPMERRVDVSDMLGFDYGEFFEGVLDGDDEGLGFENATVGNDIIHSKLHVG